MKIKLKKKDRKRVEAARKIILHGKASKETSVREIMTGRVVCIRPEQTLDECMALMSEHRIRHLPVVEGGKLAGMVSIGDVVKLRIESVEREAEDLKSYIATAG